MGKTPCGDIEEQRCRKVLLRELDDWRREQEDLPSRPEAIRRLVQGALEKG